MSLTELNSDIGYLSNENSKNSEYSVVFILPPIIHNCSYGNPLPIERPYRAYVCKCYLYTEGTPICFALSKVARRRRRSTVKHQMESMNSTLERTECLEKCSSTRILDYIFVNANAIWWLKNFQEFSDVVQ